MKLMSAAVLSVVALISACGGGGGGSDDDGVPPVVLEPNKVVLLNEDAEQGRRKLVAVDVGSGARVVLDSGSTGNYQARLVGDTVVFRRDVALDDADVFIVDLQGRNARRIEVPGVETIVGVAANQVIFEVAQAADINVLSVDVGTGKVKQLAADGLLQEKVARIVGTDVFVRTKRAESDFSLSVVPADGSVLPPRVIVSSGAAPLDAEFVDVVGNHVVYSLTAGGQTSLESRPLGEGDSTELAGAGTGAGSSIVNRYVGPLEGDRVLYERTLRNAAGQIVSVEFHSIGVNGAGPVHHNIFDVKRFHTVDGRLFFSRVDSTSGAERIFKVSGINSVPLTPFEVDSIFDAGFGSDAVSGGLMIFHRGVPGANKIDLFALTLGLASSEIPLAELEGDDRFVRLLSGGRVLFDKTVSGVSQVHSVGLKKEASRHLLAAATTDVSFVTEVAGRVVLRRATTQADVSDLVAVDPDGQNTLILSSATRNALTQ
jgi:hypothetical protein